MVKDMDLGLEEPGFTPGVPPLVGKLCFSL